MFGDITIVVFIIIVITIFAMYRKYNSIHYAVKKGDLERVRYMISKGVNINARDKGGFTPLHIAVSKGNLEMVKLLVDNGADVNAKDEHGIKPLHCAAMFGYYEIFEFLISKGAYIDTKEDWLFYLLFTPNEIRWDVGSQELQGYIKIARYLSDIYIKQGKTDDNRLLHMAALGGNIEHVKHLVENGADVNFKKEPYSYYTPLFYAILSGNLDVVKYLVENGAKVLREHLETAKKRDEEIYKYLHQHIQTQH